MAPFSDRDLSPEEIRKAQDLLKIILSDLEGVEVQQCNRPRGNKNHPQCPEDITPIAGLGRSVGQPVLRPYQCSE